MRSFEKFCENFLERHFKEEFAKSFIGSSKNPVLPTPNFNHFIFQFHCHFLVDHQQLQIENPIMLQIPLFFCFIHFLCSKIQEMKKCRCELFSLFLIPLHLSPLNEVVSIFFLDSWMKYCTVYTRFH